MRQLRHLLLVLLAVLPLGVVAPASAQNSVATDTAALTALYNATNGANWTDNTNWGTAPALSTWHGVTTDSGGRVTELELDGNGLSGTLPAELGDLTELASLRLNGNVYLAGPLPAGLRELSALATVDLADTELCAPEDAAFQDWTATISFSGLICAPTEESVIDVAVFYTPAARDDAGGTAAIEAEIDLMAAETNLAYRASGVNQRLALAAVEEVEYTATTGRGDIERLQDPSDGHMDEIHTIRDQVAADLVLLIISGSGGGRAYGILTPANASAANAFAWMHLGRGGSVTFAHELGHLMGLAHDRWSACLIGCGATATAYAHGYVNQRAFDAGAPFAARWRTVMAYNSQCREAGCPQLLRFSNPDQIYPDPGGDPLGVPGREPSTAQHGPADAARALNRTRATVASFRTAPAVTVSFGAAAYTAAEGGEAATVTVNLNPAPERRVSIPLVSMGAAGATASDYTAPRSVTFAATETAQTFTVTAVDDAADDDGETVTLAFDTRVLPSGMTIGSPATATVTLDDDDTVAGGPSVSAVALTSDPGPDAIYALGDEIEATVRFNKSVMVTGTPQLALTVGSGTRQMTHRGGAGEVLTFACTVAEGDSDTDGVGIAADSLSGTIRDSANQAAFLTHAAVVADAGHKVDGVRPLLQGAVVDGENLRLRYDEALQWNIDSQAEFHLPDAFTVTNGDDTAPVVERAFVDGPVLRLLLSRPVIHGQEATVSYTPGAWSTRDAAGTEAAAFADRPATNETPEPHYDADHDGLIEITTLAQLDAIRHDSNSNGSPAAAGLAAYRAAFPLAFPDEQSWLRCGGWCTGYELLRDLDFLDSNGDGQVDTNDDTNGDGRVAADDTPWWNGGAGWEPIGTVFEHFRGTFEGNGHTIRHLFINRPAAYPVGLFGRVGSVSSAISYTIRAVGVIEVDVTGSHYVGGLVGQNRGVVTASYSAGRVSGDSYVGYVGGLVGWNTSAGTITASYATGRVSDDYEVGGLVGRNSGTITASYATGRVSGDSYVGGLVGWNTSAGTITASYATGRVSGDSDVGGLVGRNLAATITASHWDTLTSRQATSDHGTGQTTAQLQAPTDATGIYADWNDDVWNFGEDDEYPALAMDFDGDGDATWQEFGYQLREGPALIANPGQGQVGLSWTAVTASHWTPAPSVTYTLPRNDGPTSETLGAGLSGLTFTDTDVTAGVTYTYQVAAVVQGGEASRSALASATALANMWLSPTARDPVASVRSEATYTVVFQGAWNTAVTTGGVPSGAHFTTLIGGVHNAAVTFLKEGGMATSGVESMAELGGTSTLANEVRAAEPNALSVVQGSGGNIGPTASSTINTVTLTTGHPRVTLLSMVAPSPDWFVGVSGLSLLDTQADWLPSQTVNLYPWDAGTEEGTEFSLTNFATSPQGTITSLRGIGKFSNERIATLTFTRQSVNTAPSFASDTRFEADENRAAAGTVVARDPDGGDGVTYAITGGADASKFDIGETTGVLAFKVSPNYERPADVASTDPINGAGNNEYIVTVTATGGTGDRAMTAEQTITVTVRNVEEAGTISFSQGGTRITAALNDPEGGVSSATWQWARSSNRNTGWTDIGNATSASYTPSSGDAGMYLRATVSYDDAHGSGKQAHGISTNEIAPPDLRVATLVSGLSIPWDIAFTPDGTMLFTQRPGVLSSRLADGTVQTIDAEFGDLFARGETGLMGIVVDPAFVSNRRFYTCQGHTGPEIQVIAWTLNAAYTRATRVADPLVGGIPATSGRHGGCRLRFGPEGYLWIATGDAASGTLPQDLTSLGGKVLRVDASTGAGAPANPFAASRVYTYGHRNVQGLALRPGAGQMWSVEHGPSVDDEINLLVAGRNYGWNPVPGYNEGVPMTDLVEYPDAVEAKWSSGSPTRATSGAIFLEGDQWGVWEGRLAVATLKDSKLRLFEFTSDGAFVSQVVVAELNGAFGRLRTPMMGPDGALYVSTSNGGGNDRILRLAENDPVPVTLKLTPASIGENGGVSTVTASQDRVSIAATTVTVSAMAVIPALSNDFMLSGNRILTIPAGQLDSTGTVTITADNNDADTPNKTVTVSAAADNIEGVAGPAALTLTIVDDDAAPAVTLLLRPSSIGENGRVSRVTASLNRASSAVTTMTVSAAEVPPAISNDFMLSGNRILTIPAGRTDSAGTVIVWAVDNNVDAPNKEVRVSATADNSQGIAGNPSPVTLRIIDDDDAPELTLTLRPSVIVEDGGSSAVTVEIVNRVTFTEDQEIRLSFAGTAAKGTDYTVGLERLTLTAGESSTATTVAAVDDALDDEAETIRVTARHGGGVLGAERTITIADDDASPVIVTRSPILVAENETAVATLAATDADRPAQDLTWRITGGADRNRFRLMADGMLTFAAAEDFERPGDSDGNRDYEVTVEVSDGANPVEAVFTVRLEDVDDTAPALSSASVNGTTLTLAYGEALDPNSRPAAGDFTVSGGNSARTVSNVGVSGQAVGLTLDPAVEHGETGIRVSYRPGTNPIQDAAGNDALGLSNERVTNNAGDTTAPSVRTMAITSRPGTGSTYAVGEEIEVTVTFSETVVVTGTPRLRLNVGGVNRTAAYRSGTGAALRFSYPVADGESDADGVSIEANSLTGTIRDGANNNALLTHDGVAANAGHKVDGVKPALVADGGAVVNGAALTLVFDEVLGVADIATSAFTVTGATTRSVSGVSVTGSTVRLTLSVPILHGETGIAVDYDPPVPRTHRGRGGQPGRVDHRPVGDQRHAGDDALHGRAPDDGRGAGGRSRPRENSDGDRHARPCCPAGRDDSRDRGRRRHRHGDGGNGLRDGR